MRDLDTVICSNRRAIALLSHGITPRHPTSLPSNASTPTPPHPHPLVGGIPALGILSISVGGKHHHGRSPAYSTQLTPPPTPTPLSTHCNRSEAFPRSSFSTRRATPSRPTGGLLWLSQTSSPGWTGPMTARRMGVPSCECYQGWLDAAVTALRCRSHYAAATCTSMCLPLTHEI
jgi:hypothetical protein